MRIPATLPEIESAVREILADRSVMSRDDLLDELERRGVDLGADPEDTLEEMVDGLDPFGAVPLGEDRVAYLPSLLDGRTFTHRLTGAEVTHGFLAVAADLHPLAELTEVPGYQRLCDGTRLVEALADYDDEVLEEHGVPADAAEDLVWLFPRDTFAAFVAGDLVGVTVRPEGFELTAAIPTPPPDDLAERLTAAIAEEADDEVAFLDSVMWALCADDPGLFTTPLLPLSELLDELGFASDGHEVASPGVDLDDRRAGRKVERIQGTYDLDADAALVVLVFQQLHESATALLDLAAEMSDPSELSDLAAAQPPWPEDDVVAEPDDAVDATEVIEESLPFLADPAVAEAVAVETMGAGTDGAAALGMLAETFEARAPRSARPALRWLRGKALDRLGRVLEAEQAYADALALDPDWPPALFDLARIASDRGDAERGLSLLNRAGAGPDDELVRLLQHFRPVERTDIGRNQPCWCGSGRKYKQCHRNREQLPLDERAAWLYQKAGTYVSDGPWRGEVLDLASIRSRSGSTSLWQAINDPTVADVLLFEGGAFEAFLEERGPLLPDDERLLGEQWLLAERSLYEIEQVTLGSGFRARDLRTGDRVDVRERRGSAAVRKQMLVCARFVPAGNTVQCFGGMEPVELHRRDGLLALLDSEPEPAALLEALSARFTPPQLQNTEGDPLVQCEATLRSADPDKLAEALGETYERDDDERRWHEYVQTRGMRHVRATLTLDGADVTVEANSEPRFDRVLAALRGMEPDLQVVAESRRPVADLFEAMERAPQRDAAPLEATDPQVAAVLDQFVRNHERAWLDESIPALSGVTPREAAADPSRREDLIRLLAGFPPGGPGMMDPDRLRAALGL